MKNLLFLIPIIVFIFSQCANFDLNTGNGNSMLGFSADTVSFDTVFSTIGSTTKSLKVINPNRNEVTISSIRLASAKSNFRLNIDGELGNTMNDVSIPPNDSIYIFIELTVDPTNNDSPVFIKDSILFETADTQQDVKLNAYGQDVTILRNDTIETSTWSGKPYLLLGDVYVKEGNTLTIDKGMTIYCHDALDTVDIVVMGNIEVKGTTDEPVVFKGDRFDEIWEDYKYDYVSGQWGGIVIYPSEMKSTFTDCVIRNSINGLFIGEFTSDVRTKVDLNNVVIHNNLYFGLFAINAEMNLYNCQISNSGIFNFIIAAGGSYNVYQSTIANYYGLDYQTSRSDNVCFALTNAFQFSEEYYAVNKLDEANFYNCIIDGEYDNEMAFQSTADYAFNFKFDHCLLKVSESIKEDFPDRFNSCYFNKDSLYKMVEKWNYDFSLDSLSFAFDKGDEALLTKHPALQYDLIGHERFDGLPDLGAYEFEK